MPERASETGSDEKTQEASKPSTWIIRVTAASRTQRILASVGTPSRSTVPCMHRVCASGGVCICKNVALRSLMTSDSSSVRVLLRKTRKAGDDPVPCRSGPSLGRERARRREQSLPPRQEKKTVESYGSTGMKYRAGPWPCSFFAHSLASLNAFTASAIDSGLLPARSSRRPRYRARLRLIRRPDSTRPVRRRGSRRAARPRLG
jgi:hypothetical protein